MKNLLTFLEKRIQKSEKSKQLALDILSNNPEFELMWTAESIYSESFKENFYRRFYNVLKTTDRGESGCCQSLIDEINRCFDSWNPENSTNQIRIISASWTFSILRHMVTTDIPLLKQIKNNSIK